ncbi:MAG: PD-(D/E)XK nuclease family protein [Synergistaceae bacterium]|jgi:hypothetical protein|nr:PD-(D/E)XK nuclease family protein [Synergistaceae bacterium]
MTDLYSYPKLSSLKTALKRSAGTDASSARIVYMLPSKSSEGILLDMLRSSGKYFGERPDIWSWSELYIQLVPRSRRLRCIDPPDHRLVLEFLLGRTLTELDSRGISVPGGVRRSGFIDVLSDAIRELLLEDVAPDSILGGEGEKNAAELSLRDLLYRLYTDYLLYLEGHGLADSSQMPSLTADAVNLSQPDLMRDIAIYWIGFLSFTGAQLRLVTTLRELGVSMKFFMPDSGMKNFRDVADQLGIEQKKLSSDTCSVETMISPDIHSQFEMIADEIVRRRSERDAAIGDDIGILTPPEHLRLMGLALTRRGIPYQSREETSVDRTPIAYIARGAWDVHRLGWPPKRTLNLLRDPHIGAGELDGRRFVSEMPEGVEMWRSYLKDNERALTAFERLNSFCEYIDSEEGHTGEEILRALLNLTEDGEWERRLSLEAGHDYDMDSAVREISSARLEIEQKLDMLNELSPSIGEAASLRFKGDKAMDFIAGWSREATTAFPPQYDGVVTLYGSAPPVLASHSLWVMTDVDPARYPGPSSDQPLLSGEIRTEVNDSPDTAAHLPTIHEEREQKEALFRRLAAIGEHLTVISRSGMDAGGRPQGDSPFLSSLPGDMFSGYSILRDYTIAQIAANDDEVYRGAFPRTAFSDMTNRSGKTRVRLSSIDEWALCPFSFWCGNIARFKSPLESETVFDRIFRGTVMHEMWQSIWMEYMSSPGSRKLSTVLLEQWDGAISAISVKFPAAADPRASFIMSDLKSRMLDIANWQDDTERRAGSAGLRRSRTETEFVMPEFEMENTVFSGRADRVDFWSGDFGTTAVIVDYKLGSGDAYRNSLQLASYALTLRNADIDVGGVCYAGHGDGRIRGAWSRGLDEIYGASGRDPDLDEKTEEAMEAMRRMDREALAGRYSADYDSLRCRICGYSSICRRSERYEISEKSSQDDMDERN